MNCLACGTPHDPAKDGRFCATCGMAVQSPPAKNTGKPKVEEKPVARCDECAMPLTEGASRCKVCGALQPNAEIP